MMMMSITLMHCACVHPPHTLIPVHIFTQTQALTSTHTLSHTQAHTGKDWNH